MRLFVALALDEKIRDALKAAVDELRRTRVPVRWVKPDGIHLTLKFLGETPGEKIDSLKSTLERITSGVYPFPITVSGMGAFPTLSNPRIIWAGVLEPSGSLEKVWDSLEAAAAAMGWKRERRGFRPHVTVGRVRGNINIKQLASAVGNMQNSVWGEQESRGLSLYRSYLDPGGAKYEVIRFFPFLGGT